MSAASQIREISARIDSATLEAEVRTHLDDQFSDLGALTGHAGPSNVRKGKRRRGLSDEISYWENKSALAQKELDETSATLPGLLQTTQEKLGMLLRSAQDLSLERYALADKMSTLISELNSGEAKSNGDTNGQRDAGQEATQEERQKSVLERMETMQTELQHLEAGLLWISVLEQVLVLSERTLDERGHRPSPLAALPHYTALYELVEKVKKTLPRGTALLDVIVEVRQKTWAGLKDVMSKNLLQASEALRWPLKVDYPSVPPLQRRAFERAYQDLLYLQAEGENLGVGRDDTVEWYNGHGLYPLQAMVQPIALRFKYHFQGSRNTNRVDKPEWAFTHIVDRIYEHQSFIEEYLEPLTRKAGYGSIDVKSEFIMLLFPILLGLLRSRIPHLLDTPALLAHTIYQTVVFDDTVRENGFDIASVSINEGKDVIDSWEGLAGVVLKHEDWFDRWIAGEKKFAEGQLHEIISSSDAWTISDEASDADGGLAEDDLKPTTSARQVKALIEQVTDRYSPLPSLVHRLPFLTSIQLPLLTTYLSRISGSLDAFETISSAFVRVVPGALSGNTRSGAHIDQTKLTSGKAGLERLIKANLSGSFLVAALKSWGDELFFVEMTADLRDNRDLKAKLQNEMKLPLGLRANDGPVGTVFDVMVERFDALVSRTEDMIVRHISAEVETDLKQHLTKRWDRSEGDSLPDSSLLHALTTYRSHLSTLSLLPSIPQSRLYRRIANHLTNHISQRAVYAGWSKFSVLGGKDFAAEIQDWINTSRDLSLPGGETAVNAPWKGLEEIGWVLSLPAELMGDDVTFGQAMAIAWSDGEDGWRGWVERTGMRMGREELKGVLKRRADCWR